MVTGKDIANLVFVMDKQYWFFLIVGVFFAIPHTKLNELAHKNAGTEITTDLVMIVVFVLLQYVIWLVVAIVHFYILDSKLI